MSDDQVLTLAAESQRVLVSHDVGTMPAHFRAFRDAGNHSAGVFLIPQSLDMGGQSTNSCSSGWLRKHRSGLIGWNGCRSEIMPSTSCSRSRR